MKEFEKLVSSPFFNRGRNYLPFLDQLKKFHPKFDDPKMTPEYIYSKINPGKEFNKQIVWNMTSALSNIAEDFLMLHTLRKNKFIKNNCIAEEFLERNQTDYLAKKLTEMESTLDSEGVYQDYFLLKRQLETRWIECRFREDMQHLISNHHARKGEYAILDFLTAIVGAISGMDTSIRMFNARFDFNLSYEFIRKLNLEKIIEYAKAKDFRYSWLMEMYHCSIMIAIEQDFVKYFSKVKKLFEEHFDDFDQDERNIWITHLTNYCVRGYEKDANYFRREYFEINKFHLREISLSGSKYISKFRFLGILRNALAIREIEWAKNFIEEFVPKLRQPYRKSTCAFGYAFLNFSLKNFDVVLENLRNVKFIDSRDKLNVRSLYIRTYYELGEIETVLSQIDAAKHFLNKNISLPATTKAKYFNSLNLLNRLITARYNNDDYEIASVRKATEADKEIVFGKWLREKTEELKPKKKLEKPAHHGI